MSHHAGTVPVYLRVGNGARATEAHIGDLDVEATGPLGAPVTRVDIAGLPALLHAVADAMGDAVPEITAVPGGKSRRITLERIAAMHGASS